MNSLLFELSLGVAIYVALTFHKVSISNYVPCLAY